MMGRGRPAGPRRSNDHVDSTAQDCRSWSFDRAGRRHHALISYVLNTPEPAARPYRIPMHDREIVAAIVAGDATGLGAAFGQYAQALYAYCRSQLTEPADAADAVHDTFVIASSKLAGLREPDRLRAWLFAVTRNECHGRQSADGSVAPRHEAAETTDNVGDADAEQAELRAVVHAAHAALYPGEREIVELNLRHGLDGADLADVLGMPRKQAAALAWRVQSKFDTSLGVLLVNRPGPEDCPDLAAMLDGWNGELTARLRTRVKLHVQRCEACARKRGELTPVMLLNLLPVTILPAGLRQQFFRLVGDVSPDAAALRARVAQRAEPFGAGGFPLQRTTPSVPRWQGSYPIAAVAAVAALGVLGGGMFFVDYTLGHHAPPRAAAVRTPTPRPTRTSRSIGALAVTPSAAAAAPPGSASTVLAPVSTPTTKSSAKTLKSASPSPSRSRAPRTSPSPTPRPSTSPSPTSPPPKSPSPSPTSPSPTSPTPTSPTPKGPSPATPSS